MHTLIISTAEVRQQVEHALRSAGEIIWTDCLSGAMNELEETDIDAVIYDGRTPWAANDEYDLEDPFDGSPSLKALNIPEFKALIANLSVTTRLMAIVDQLPDGEFFAESGVIYLTPPVNLDDIRWFIRSQN